MPSRQLRGREPRRRVDVDAHHRSSHARQPIRGQEGRSHDHREPLRPATELDRRGLARHRRRGCCRRHPASRSYAEYVERGGYQPLDDPDGLLDEVDRSGLLGRGGAAFPLAVKLTTVRDAGRAGQRTVVLANGEEGEPASVKDRWLLRNRPHLVLDGVRLAARIVGAERAVRLRLRSRMPPKP